MVKFGKIILEYLEENISVYIIHAKVPRYDTAKYNQEPFTMPWIKIYCLEKVMIKSAI